MHSAAHGMKAKMTSLRLASACCLTPGTARAPCSMKLSMTRWNLLDLRESRLTRQHSHVSAGKSDESRKG